MPKLFIAIGHSLTDPGAVSQFGNERDIIIPCVNKAFELCKTQNTNGFELIRVPDALDLVGAINFINNGITDYNNDECAEIHLNSNAGNPGTGTETYPGNIELATEMHNKIVEVLGLPNRGIKGGDWLMFNNSTKCMSCLIELGFVNNQHDVEVIIERGGLAIAKAMIEACNSTWKDPVVEPPKPPIVTPPVVVPEPPVIVEPPKPEPQPPIQPPIVVEPPEQSPEHNWLVLLMLLIWSKIKSLMVKKG